MSGAGSREPDAPGAREELLAAYTTQAQAAAAVVHRCPGPEAVVELVAALAAGGTVSASPSLIERHPRLAALLAERVALSSAAGAIEAAGAAVGVSVGEAVVAESGSVLVSELELGDRAVSMLSPVLVQVVAADAVLATLDEVAAMLAERAGAAGYHALISGPSRSADIERSLTIGVQGPSELHVAILGGEEAKA